MSLELDEAYRPGEDEPFMNERQVEYFRRKLLQRRSLRGQELLGVLDRVDAGDLDAGLDESGQRAEHAGRELWHAWLAGKERSGF